jgi:hypothetical protein
MVLYDTMTSLEDPFDDTALDAISIFEMLDQLGVVRRGEAWMLLFLEMLAEKQLAGRAGRRVLGPEGFGAW